MRRGKLSPKALLILVVVAFFTLSSFIFDQLVILTENKIRELNYEYEKNFNLYSSATTVIRATDSLSVRANTKKLSFDVRAEILQAAIFAIKFQENYFKEHFDENFDSKFQENLSKIFTSAYGSMYLDLFYEVDISFDLFRGIPIRGMDKKIFDKENKDIAENFMKYGRIMSNDKIKHWELYLDLPRTYEIITQDDFLNYRKHFFDFLSVYKEANTHINNINGIYVKYMNFYFQETRNSLREKNKMQNRRNIFILLSVLTQILSLFSLIILFKILLNSFVIKNKI